VLLITLFLLNAKPLAADPVPVRRTQGTFHGFLVLKTLDGKTLATGDLIQVAHGNRVTSRLIFHFRDGSVDDDVTVFPSTRSFGSSVIITSSTAPSFPKPLDMFIDARTGQITILDNDQKTTQNHLDLDPDICRASPYPVAQPRF
jgi:hypothetical protein